MKINFLLFILIGLRLFSFGQQSNSGKNFWIAFGDHSNFSELRNSIYVTGDSNCTGVVSVFGTSWSDTFQVIGGQTTILTIPKDSVRLNCSNCIEKKAVQIITDKNVVIYSHQNARRSSDASLILPTTALGKSYITLAYQPRGSNSRTYFNIIADKDSTKIKIKPSADIVNFNLSSTSIKADSTFYIVLNKGEVFHAQSHPNDIIHDLSGSEIDVIDTGFNASCKTIAVFSGLNFVQIHDNATNLCTHSVSNGGTGDNIYQQIFPLHAAGKTFVTIPFKDRINYNCRLLAMENNTTITVLPGTGIPQNITLNKGEYATLHNIRSTLVLIATKPITVAQYQLTSICDGFNAYEGDPSMSIISPLEQTIKKSTIFSPRFYSIIDNYLNVLIPTNDTVNFRLDSVSVSFIPVPRLSSWSYAQIKVNQGNSTLSSKSGFIVNAYGQGVFESYSYVGGTNIQNLSVSARLSNSVQSNSNVSCLADTSFFNGEANFNASNWIWDFGNGDSAYAQNPKYVFKDTGLYKVKLFAYKSINDGCSTYDSTELEVRVYGKPQAVFRTSTLCEKEHIVFVNKSVFPSPEEQQFIRWEFDNGEFYYEDSISKYYDTTGVFNIALTITSFQNCQSTLRDTFVIAPKPIILFHTDSVCFKNTFNLITQSEIETGSIIKYHWIFENGDTINDSLANYFFPNEGFNSVKLIAISDKDCETSYSDSIYKFNRFQAAIQGSDTCFGIHSFFTNTSFLNGGSWSYNYWTLDFDSIYISWDFDILFDSIGEKTVYLVMKQNNKCLDTAAFVMNVFPNPIPSFDQIQICYGDTIQLKNSTETTSDSYFSKWIVENIDTFTTRDLSFFTSQAGNKNITLEIISEENCIGSLTDKIYVIKNEINDFENIRLCNNETKLIRPRYTLDNDSIVEFKWLFEAFENLDSILLFSSSQLGINEILFSFNTINHCFLSEKVAVEVIKAPESNFIINDICLNDVLSIVNLTTNPQSNIKSAFWYLNDTLSSSEVNYSEIQKRVGLNNIRLSVISENDCVDSVQQSFTVFPLPNSNFDVKNMCYLDTTIFEYKSDIISGDIINFRWRINNTTFFDSTVHYSFDSPGLYTVILFAESDQNCADSLDREIRIFPNPNIDLDIPFYNACVPFLPIIQNNSSIDDGFIKQFVWDWGDGNITFNDTLNTYDSIGYFIATLSAISDQNCLSVSNFDSIFWVKPIPIAKFKILPHSDLSIINGEIQLDDLSVDAKSWSWLISDGSSYSRKNTFHTFKDTGFFSVQLIVSNEFNCFDTSIQSVNINSNLYNLLPNSFTPNNDFLNDEFGISGSTESISDFEMIIYNRWKQIVFKSNDPKIKWNGKTSGKLVPQGNYLYLIKYKSSIDGQVYKYRGLISVWY